MLGPICRIYARSSSAIVVYQQQPLIWTGENFQTEEAQQYKATEKAVGTKEDSNIVEEVYIFYISIFHFSILCVKMDWIMFDQLL